MAVITSAATPLAGPCVHAARGTNSGQTEGRVRWVEVEVTGEVTGEVTVEVTVEVTGEVTGEMTGEVTGGVKVKDVVVTRVCLCDVM